MDLIYNGKKYIPSKDFWGKLSKERFQKIFHYSTRFMTKLMFSNSSKRFVELYNFVIDTGAFISYAPDIILEDLNVEPIFEGFIRGADPRKESKIKTKITEVSFILIDDNGTESKELKAWFAFHPFDKGPFLLGMKDIIENFGIIKEINRNQLILQIE